MLKEESWYRKETLTKVSMLSNLFNQPGEDIVIDEFHDILGQTNYEELRHFSTVKSSSRDTLHCVKHFGYWTHAKLEQRCFAAQYVT